MAVVVKLSENHVINHVKAFDVVLDLAIICIFGGYSIVPLTLISVEEEEGEK